MDDGFSKSAVTLTQTKIEAILKKVPASECQLVERSALALSSDQLK